MKNTKKVFMLVTSLGLAVGMASAAWGDDSSARIHKSNATESKRLIAPQRRISTVADKKMQDLPDTITVDGVAYKKVRMRHLFGS